MALVKLEELEQTYADLLTVTKRIELSPSQHGEAARKFQEQQTALISEQQRLLGLNSAARLEEKDPGLRRRMARWALAVAVGGVVIPAGISTGLVTAMDMHSGVMPLLQEWSGLPLDDPQVKGAIVGGSALATGAVATYAFWKLFGILNPQKPAKPKKEWANVRFEDFVKAINEWLAQQAWVHSTGDFHVEVKTDAEISPFLEGKPYRIRHSELERQGMSEHRIRFEFARNLPSQRTPRRVIGIVARRMFRLSRSMNLSWPFRSPEEAAADLARSLRPAFPALRLSGQAGNELSSRIGKVPVKDRIVAVDLSVRWVRAALVDRNTGEILVRSSPAILGDADRSDKGTVLVLIRSRMEDLLWKVGLGWQEVGSIAVSTPGHVNEKTGAIGLLRNLPFEHQNLANLIERSLSSPGMALPPIRVFNDTVAAVWAEAPSRGC
jgi:hypothetical protein